MWIFKVDEGDRHGAVSAARRIDPLGVLWGLGAAVGLATNFVFRAVGPRRFRAALGCRREWPASRRYRDGGDGRT